PGHPRHLPSFPTRRSSDLVSPGVVPWRSTAALAHLALGDRARGEELAIEELEQAQQIGVTRVAIRALRVLGLCAGGMAGIELLRSEEHTSELQSQSNLVCR